MNRAWIPAGALAGVSVAGLIALGPLTHFDTPVSFPGSLTIDSSSPTKASSKSVAVHINEGTVGGTRSIQVKPAVSRGGPAADATAPVSGESGAVGYRIPHASHSSTNSTTTSSTAPKAKPKKTTKRANSPIGASSGPNGDNGLAGVGSGSSTNVGAQSGTPGSDAP
jgi:hypothetical protein